MSVIRGTRPSTARRRPVTLALVALSTMLLAACGSRVEEGEVLPAAPLEGEDPGLAHVHGLGVNPADGLVYVATHFGLWRLSGSGEPERVGEYFHDLMGFTVVGEDHFLASGHPSGGDLPPQLGLIETTDAGTTWRSVSLLGGADFHALSAAHGKVYGWNTADSAFMVSDDGRDWEERSTVRILDFAVAPDDPDEVLATIAESRGDTSVARSRDGGRTWEEIDAPSLGRPAWPDGDVVWAVGVDGVLWRSEDRGAIWEEGASLGGFPEAFFAHEDRLYVAAGGVIALSEDEGESWDALVRYG
ncbi:MAG: hypothetical protein KY462_06655 [Actinobacteria bacterium]|nr:hypothetical protein [Actinomycetota bacterium]